MEGSSHYGYEATILPELCDAVLSARVAGSLNYQQKHIAQQCEILVRAFARVGIIAPVKFAGVFACLLIGLVAILAEIAVASHYPMVKAQGSPTGFAPVLAGSDALWNATWGFCC